MSKSSFYSGSGLTNTEQDAIEGAKNAAEDARDAAQAAQTAAEAARDLAQSSSSTASGHAATATTKADEASGSANTANNHASTATTKADEASTSASNAADDADDAQKLAINAEDSQFTLSDGSTTGYSALHHKEKALDAQTAAETAKTAAEAAQTAAEAALADFEGVYLGPHASDPTQDANGDNVGAGDLYFNTTDSELLVYNGTNWVTSGVTTTATTSDNGLMSSSDKTKLDGIEASADVTDAANVDPLVDTHLNTGTANSGEYLKWTGTDYDWASVPAGYADSDVDTHLNVSGASANQFLKYNGSDYAWDDVDLSSKLSLTGGTMTGAIRLDDTNIIFDDTSGYSLTLKATSTATSNKTISLPNATGTVALATTTTNFSALQRFSSGLMLDSFEYLHWGNDEEGAAITGSYLSNSLTFSTDNVSRLQINDSGLYLYAGGTLRFEGANANNYETTLTVVDATADRTISLPNSSGILYLDPNTASYTASADADNLVIADSGNVGITIHSSDNNATMINFSDAADNSAGWINYVHAVDTMYLGAGDSNRLQIKSDEILAMTDISIPLLKHLNLSASSNIKFDSTAGAYTTSLVGDSATANRTITLPDASGDVFLSNTNGGTQSFSLSGVNSTTGVESYLELGAIGSNYLIPSVNKAQIYAVSTDVAGTDFADLYLKSGSLIKLENTTSVNGDLRLEEDHVLIFEGATNDDFQTTLTVVDATADRTISLPDEDGTILLMDSSGDVTIDNELTLGTAGNIKIFGNPINGKYYFQVKPDGSNLSLSVTDDNIALSNNATLQFSNPSTSGNTIIASTASSSTVRNIDLPDQDGTLMLWQSAWPDDPAFENIAIGDSALSSVTSTGVQNIAIGPSAATALTTGDYCTAIGWNAMLNNTTDSYTTSVGWQSGGGDLLTGGTYLGAHAGNYVSSSKDYQVAIGYFAMTDCQGDESVAVGTLAMSDGNHYRSVAVGHDALGRSSTSSPYYNVAVGYASANGLSAGDYNTLCGYDTETYYNNTSYATVIGAQARVSYAHSVSIGYRAGYSIYGQSDYCTLIGNYAGYDMDGGDYCTFVGYQAGYAGGSGQSNTGIGIQSLYALSSGTQNTGCGRGTFDNLSSGDNNTACGSGAGYNQTTSDNNTFVGYDAGYNVTTGSNLTVLGANADPSSNTATNEVTLGNSSVATLRCNVQTISSLSDERDKTAIEDLSYGLDFINDMRPVQFTWNRRDGSLGAKPDMGFIAQDLYDVELTHSSTSRTRLVNWENPAKLEADYVRSYPILVKAVQELSAKCNALEARIAELEGV